MVPRKGVDNVIRGLARLRSRPGDRGASGDRWRRVETDSPDSGAISPEIGRLQRDCRCRRGWRRGLTFVGRRDRPALRDYYAAADVFVTTPWYEPFGITPVEAMACGTPVVGSAVGGIKSTVVDGETGYLVPPADPAALADRLARLLRHPDLLRQFGRQASRRANALYPWKRIAAAVAGVYDAVASGRTKVAPMARPARILGSPETNRRGWTAP